MSGRTPLTGEYKSYAAVRALGWLIGLGSIAVGGLMAMNEESRWTGVGIATGGGVVGMLMAKSDEANVTVGSLSTSSGVHVAGADASWSKRLGLEGVTVGVRF